MKFNLKNILQRTFQINFKDIFVKILPILFLFVGVKIIIVYFFENKGLWIDNNDLEILFTILGFTLGIILAQKIAITYGKWLDIHRTQAELQGHMTSIKIFLDGMKESCGKNAFIVWGKEYLEIFKIKDDGSARVLEKINSKLYKKILSEIGDDSIIPHHRFCALLSNMFVSANVVVILKSTYTPKIYNEFLHEIILFYVSLLIIFIPGIGGMISVAISIYLLYGMYYLTDDFDISGQFSKDQLMIKLAPKRIENYIKSLSK